MWVWFFCEFEKILFNVLSAKTVGPCGCVVLSARSKEDADIKRLTMTWSVMNLAR